MYRTIYLSSDILCMMELASRYEYCKTRNIGLKMNVLRLSIKEAKELFESENQIYDGPNELPTGFWYRMTNMNDGKIDVYQLLLETTDT